MVSFSMQLMNTMPGPRFCVPWCGRRGRGGLGDEAEVELHHRLVGVGDVELVLLQLVLDVFGVVPPVGHRRQHRVGDVPDPAQAGGFRAPGRRWKYPPHTATMIGTRFLGAQFQAEVIYTLHCFESVNSAIRRIITRGRFSPARSASRMVPCGFDFKSGAGAPRGDKCSEAVLIEGWAGVSF